MKYRHRLIEARIEAICRHFPVVVVTGARQVGKSTMIRHCFCRGRKVVVFEPHQDLLGARRDPDFFLQNHPAPLFLDEIQYAPELLSAIKRKVDETPAPGAYLLSGSQNLAMVKGVAESLAGRAALVHLDAFSRREEFASPEADSFILAWVDSGGSATAPATVPPPPCPVLDLIWRGAHPKLAAMPIEMATTYWDSYLQTYIERDLRSIADIGSMATFSRFFGMLAAMTGCELNHHQMGRELDIDRTTALRWTGIAEATYQWRSLPAFSRNALKRVAGKQKGHFTDTGFACHLQKIASPGSLQAHPAFGHLFESWVIMEIIKAFHGRRAAPTFWHYRTYAGAEVDIILEWDGRLFPVEIKATANPKPADALGIRSFRACFPRERIAPGLIVCATKSPHRVSADAYAVPWWIL